MNHCLPAITYKSKTKQNIWWAINKNVEFREMSLLIF